MYTLVVSNGMMAVRIISWQKAIKLYYNEKVRIQHWYTDKVIRTPNGTHPMPCVVSEIGSKSNTKRVVRLTKHNLYLRDKGKCQYCDKRMTKDEATIDHVIPRSKGGKHTWDNVVLCCLGCNQYKGDDLLENAGVRLKKKPYAPTVSPTRWGIIDNVPDEWTYYIPELKQPTLDEGVWS